MRSSPTSKATPTVLRLSSMGTGLTVSAAVAAHRDEIRAIVEANRATNPRVFGSIARGEDSADSDLDLLVDACPGMTLFDQARIIGALEELLGVEVDVVTSGAGSDRFRAAVLGEAVPL
jgi:predicted nucleotidyltransferase